MATPACSLNVDSQLFTIYFSRGDAIVYTTSSGTYNIIAGAIKNITANGFTVIAVTSSGPGGNYTYAGSGFAAYLAKFGGGNPWPTNFGGPPGGLIDDNGTLYCPPPPASSGGGFSCPSGYYYDPESELCIPTPPPPGFPPIGPPIGPGGGGGGGNPPQPPSGQGGPDPDGDSVTNELCQQLWAQTAAIISAIQGIGGSPGAGSDDSEIDQLLINALITLNATLNSFETFLSNLLAPTGNANPDPVTCAQLTAQFDKLIAAINGGDVPVNPTPPVAPADFTPTPYTVKDALADIEAAKDSMPFVVPPSQ